METVKLYSKTTNGKIKEWCIGVTGKKELGKIVIRTGLQGGKQTVFEVLIDKGKNIGKKNETSPLQQAINEANTKINKKLDAGFTKELNTKTNSLILPMLALKYQEAGHRIKFPCYIQPKIDGLRAVYQNKALYSRLKNQFQNLEHITNELHSCKLNLDGELYSELSCTLSNEVSNGEGSREPNKVSNGVVKSKENKREKGQETVLTFQELNGLVKKKKLNEKDKQDILHLTYIIYDIVIPNKTFKERYEMLKDLFNKNNFKYIKLLETYEAKDKEEIVKYHKKFIKEGYEGSIIRNSDGLYKQKNRSADLQKFKDFQDKEFKIIGFKEGENSTEKGCIIWRCITKDKKEFDVRPKGTFEERRKLFKNGDKYIGEYLTVKFFDYSDDGVPFHASTMYGGTADVRSITQI
jgi:DNA ligase-1